MARTLPNAFRHYAFLTGAFLVCSSCRSVDLGTLPVDAKLHGEFPISWAQQIQFVFRDFQKDSFVNNGAGLDCYYMSTYKEDDTYFINVLAYRELKPLGGDRFQVVASGGDQCGRGASYEFELTGEFRRKVYQR